MNSHNTTKLVPRRPQETTKGHLQTRKLSAEGIDLDTLDVTTIRWDKLERQYRELRAMMSAPVSSATIGGARSAQKSRAAALVVELLDTAQLKCRRLLMEGNARGALDCGLLTLRLKEDYYGSSSLTVLPLYFHVARVHQYLNQYKEAEEFLSLAQWILIRTGSSDSSLKAELHQTFGLLYAADGKLEAALCQLSSATFFLCEVYGTRHVLTSFSYFDVGNVFAATAQMEQAMGFYEVVKEIWYDFLLLQLRGEKMESKDKTKSNVDSRDPVPLGAEHIQDARKMLGGIVQLQQERFDALHTATAFAHVVFGLFLLWTEDRSAAAKTLARAIDITKRVYGEKHEYATEVEEIAKEHSFDLSGAASTVAYEAL